MSQAPSFFSSSSSTAPPFCLPSFSIFLAAIQPFSGLLIIFQCIYLLAFFFFFFFFFFFLSFFLIKFFVCLCCRNRNRYEYNLFSEDEEEEEAEEDQEETRFHVECLEKDHLVADIIHGSDALFFQPNSHPQRNQSLSQEFMSINEDPDEDYAPEILSVDDSHEGDDMFEDEDLPPRDSADSVFSSVPNLGGPTMPKTTIDNDKNCHGK
jgi:hypothetical protein